MTLTGWYGPTVASGSDGCEACCVRKIPPPPCPAPECWTISVSGTTSCPWFNNRSYSVPSTGAGTWSCTVPDECTDCGDFTLSVVFADGIVTVSAGPYQWTASYTGCYEIGEFTVVQDNGDASAAVSLTPKYTGPCNCACSSYCPQCAGGLFPPYVQVTISGATDGTCTNCEAADGTYILETYHVRGFNCARWTACYNITGSGFCPSRPDCTQIGLTFRLEGNGVGNVTAYLFVGHCNCSSGSDVCGSSNSTVVGSGEFDCVGFELDMSYSETCCDWGTVIVEPLGTPA